MCERICEPLASFLFLPVPSLPSRAQPRDALSPLGAEPRVKEALTMASTRALASEGGGAPVAATPLCQDRRPTRVAAKSKRATWGCQHSSPAWQHGPPSRGLGNLSPPSSRSPGPTPDTRTREHETARPRVNTRCALDDRIGESGNKTHTQGLLERLAAAYSGVGRVCGDLAHRAPAHPHAHTIGGGEVPDRTTQPHGCSSPHTL
jgi:hypothetical protein